MSVTHRSVLVALVDQYDATGKPQSPDSIASALDSPPVEVATHLESLADYELVTSDGGTYRPTLTGRELLELDVFDDGGIIIDVPDE